MKFVYLLLIFVSVLFSQDNSNIDTIILKDGSTIKCTIIEFVPGKLIKFSTSGGSELQIDMAEVASIQRSSENIHKYAPIDNSDYRKHLNYRAKISFCKYGWATTAGVTLLGSAAMGDESFATTVIPVVGPFMTISQIESDPNLDYLPGAKNMLLASGILQASFVSFWFMFELIDMSLPTNIAIAILPQSESVGLSVAYIF